MAEHPRDLDDLVEVVDPDHPELREDGVVHGIRTGQMAGVGLGHRPPLVGAAHLDHDDGHPVLGPPIWAASIRVRPSLNPST